MIYFIDSKVRNQLRISEEMLCVPKVPLYKKYFDDQLKNYPRKFVTVSLMSYVGGCFFGFVMLAFSMLGSTRMEQSVASLSSADNFYKDMTEFKKAIKQVRFNYKLNIIK